MVCLNMLVLNILSILPTFLIFNHLSSKHKIEQCLFPIQSINISNISFSASNMHTNHYKTENYLLFFSSPFLSIHK